MENRACQTNLILFFDEITTLADKEEIIEFCKAFGFALCDFVIKNSVPYNINEAHFE